MNTKEVMLNVIQSQLEIKENEFKQFHENTTQPEFEKLNEYIRQWFNNELNVNVDKIEFSGRSLSFDEDNNIELIINKYWNTEEKDYTIELKWNSGRRNKDSIEAISNNFKILYAISSKFDLVQFYYINDWYKRYLEINDNDSKARIEMDQLRDAVSKLKTEIFNDKLELMRTNGFELRRFKPRYLAESHYDENNNRYYVMGERDQSFSLQYGRSQYDTIYVNGFKVLNKKGNKYNIEVYRDGMINKTCNVLEKKFDSFIYNVSDWEENGSKKSYYNAEQQVKAYEKR